LRPGYFHETDVTIKIILPVLSKSTFFFKFDASASAVERYKDVLPTPPFPVKKMNFVFDNQNSKLREAQ
jgi:hypothetical protein